MEKYVCVDGKIVESSKASFRKENIVFHLEIFSDYREWADKVSLDTKRKRALLSITDNSELLYLFQFLGSPFGLAIEKDSNKIAWLPPKDSFHRELFSTIECRDLTSFLRELFHFLVSKVSDRIEEIDSELDKIEESLAREETVEAKRFLRVQRKLRLVRRTTRNLLHVVLKSKGLQGVLPEVLRGLEDDIVLLEDHLTQSYERLNTMLGLLHDVDSDKLNKLVARLTLFSMIFLPLTLIASIYGMNFRYMPELYHPYGYFITLTVMALIAIIMLVYFKKKHWI